MTNLTRASGLIALVAVMALVAACGGAASSPAASPSPSASGAPIGGTVDTPEEALAAVIAKEPRFAGIGPYQADLIGQSAWYKVTPASGVGAFVVEIRLGWGDCQAGCIDEHSWLFAVLPDGTVNLQSETGSPVPPEEWPTPVGAGGTGIDGMAVAGPTCPVETVDDPACAPRPVAGATIVVLDGSGTEVARTTTGVDGAFFISVAAGDYTVRTEAVDGLMGTPDPTAVTVSEGDAVRLQLGYDTGIR